jgi:hypothetical protein
LIWWKKRKLLTRVKRKHKGIANMKIMKQIARTTRSLNTPISASGECMKEVAFVTRIINAPPEERSDINLSPFELLHNSFSDIVSVLCDLARPDRQDFNGDLFLRVRI